MSEAMPQWERDLLATVGDDLDVAAGRCCPNCRHMLTDHNVAVWNAGYTVAMRHAKGDMAQAWDDGWHDHYLQDEAQRENPRHPIMKRNPHRDNSVQPCPCGCGAQA